MRMSSSVSEYLARIGRKGGVKSRRSLSSEEARAMVRVREARRAFRKFHAQCFWYMREDIDLTLADRAGEYSVMRKGAPMNVKRQCSLASGTLTVWRSWKGRNCSDWAFESKPEYCTNAGCYAGRNIRQPLPKGPRSRIRRSPPSGLATGGRKIMPGCSSTIAWPSRCPNRSSCG